MLGVVGVCFGRAIDRVGDACEQVPHLVAVNENRIFAVAVKEESASAVEFPADKLDVLDSLDLRK